VASSDKKLRKKRNSKLTPVSDVLQSLLQKGKGPLSQQFKRWRLWRFWGEVVGETIAENTTPVGYSKGVLYVWVKNSVQLQELLFFAIPLRNRVNEYLGYKWVKMVRFTTDRKSVPHVEESNPKFKNFVQR